MIVDKEILANSLLVLRYVERGVIRDTVVQKPFNMGYLGITTAREFILAGSPHGSSTRARSISPRPSMFQPEDQKLQFPVTVGP